MDLARMPGRTDASLPYAAPAFRAGQLQCRVAWYMDKLHAQTAIGHRLPGRDAVWSGVLHDHKAVLDTDATIAGPGAEVIRSGALTQASLGWLKTNLLKTALELGHCLRLPTEGPCECDLFFACSRFVTAPAYAPRLRERRQLELTLVEEAWRSGWACEAERHRCIAERTGKLLANMGTQA